MLILKEAEYLKFFDYNYYKIPKDKQKLFGVGELVFGYEPIYLGKGVSSTGHRFSQHIAEFINKEKY